MPDPDPSSSNANVGERHLSVRETLQNAQTRAGLEAHVDRLHRGQQVVNQTKPGQRLAEEMTVGEQPGQQKAELPTDAELRSKALMRLVELTKYDDTAQEDVLKLAKGGEDLADPQMWNLIVGNSRFMDHIQSGLTVNKILPDATIQDVLQHKQTWVPKDKSGVATGPGGSQVGGSVADERYYEKLTGEQAIANFGLDYGGYKEGTMKSDKITSGTDGGLSSYVYKAPPDAEGRTLKTVPNVFYVKVKVPETSLAQVKVPVHSNVSKWASEKLKEVNQAIGDPLQIKALAQTAGSTEDEMLNKLKEKQAILQKFTQNCKVDEGMLTTVVQDGGEWAKNTEDPLTNMGMTKPSDRLQTDFDTINQEYHIGARFDIPEGSGLYMKDASGKDLKVGELVKNSTTNRPEWGKLNHVLINEKLTQNQTVRNEGEVILAKAKLKTPGPKTVGPAPNEPSEIQQAIAKLKPSHLPSVRDRMLAEQVEHSPTSVGPKVSKITPNVGGHR